MHALAIYVFYFLLEMGFLGISIASACMFMARFFMNVGMVSYSKSFKSTPNITFWEKKSFNFKDPVFKQQIWLCIYALGMGVWGYWVFDIFALMASYMSASVIAA